MHHTLPRAPQRFVDEGVAAAHIDGETPAAERERLFAELRSGTTLVLCNCDVLTEGFDEPRVACVLLARPTNSRRMYLQARLVLCSHVRSYIGTCCA